MSEIFCNKKIIFVFSRLELGGAERQGFLLAKYLKDTYEADIEIIGLQGQPGKLSELCCHAGIPCRSLQVGNMCTKLDWLKALLYFLSDMLKVRPVLLVSYTTRANVISALAWRLVRAKGFIWNQADEGLGMRRTFMSKLAVSLTPHFISNSSGGNQFLKNSYAVPNKKISTIYNGVELSPPLASRREWRKRINVCEDDLIVCMVANISRFKDHVTLLKAWRKVIDSTCTNAVLVLAGRFDGTEKDLIKLSDDLCLGEQVRFIGAVEDVSGLLYAVDLFAYSSKSEGLPNAVVEAMAAGLPVVGTDIPGIREALGTVHSSYLAPVGDAEGLAHAIMMIIDNPNQGRSYGEELRQRAKSDFSLPVMLGRSVQVLTDYMNYRVPLVSSLEQAVKK